MNTITTLLQLWNLLVLKNDIIKVEASSVGTAIKPINNAMVHVCIPHIWIQCKKQDRVISIIYDNIGGQLHSGTWQCIELHYEGCYDVLVITEDMLTDSDCNVKDMINDWKNFTE